jgi:hypothetical protein
LAKRSHKQLRAQFVQVRNMQVNKQLGSKIYSF